ncbi:MAG: hypothetical protein QM535_05935 [Limnohabitans sp.]|nr:hypothetical protein [Limnohabitans sp.]
MKITIKFLLAIFLFIAINENSFSQGPPPWAPAHGYRAKTRYVYFPDQNFYYDLNTRNYIYLSGPNWSISATLPKLFVGINLGKSSQVELDFAGDRPYRYNGEHLVRYKVKKTKKIKEKHKTVEINIFNSGHHESHGRGRGHGHGKH